MASVSTVATGSNTPRGMWDSSTSLRINFGPKQMSFELCASGQDPQMEFALVRESLGVRRINHILRVHGHTILQEKRAAVFYGEVGQRSFERLFQGFREDSSKQAIPVLGTRERGTSLVQHIVQHSLQPNRGSSLRYKMQSQPDFSRNNPC